MKSRVWDRTVYVVVVIELLVVCCGVRAFGVTFTNDTLITATDFSFEGGDVVVSNCVLTIDGAHSFQSMRVATGGTVTHLDPLTSTTNAGLFLTISNDLEIEPGAFIKANGRGYSGGSGPGAGGQAGGPSSGGGGGYGGYGGLSSSNALGGAPYGSPFVSPQFGSSGGFGSGGPGGAGGGLIQLSVTNRLILNGTISASGADATNSRAGGGSGGGVWIVASSIEGSGAVSANGGAGEPIHGGGGGGGRIAIQTATTNFTGSLSAIGGSGWQRGGAGTVFQSIAGSAGSVTVDNANNAGAPTLLDLDGQAPNLTMQGKAVVMFSNSQTCNSLLVRSNCSLTVTNTQGINISALGSATIEAGASVMLDGKGFPQNSGSGVGFVTGSPQIAGGSGHGGSGGSGVFGASAAAGGPNYGSSVNPVTAGSGGRSVTGYTAGAGGGIVRMIVSGELRVDGRMSADATGSTGSSGGASGGSIWLTAGKLSGAGVISANGSAGGLPYGGGGAGGRISLGYGTNIFAGTISAHGGAGAVAGAAGTIYSISNNFAYGNFLVDNAGLTGATNTIVDISTLNQLSVLGGASASPSSSGMSLAFLTVGSNSTLLLTQSSSTFTVSGNAIISGTLFADGTGTSSGGSPSLQGSGGGGNAGYGGRGAAANGGFYFGNSSGSTTPGSRGGSASGAGPNGGGALRMTVTGSLVVDGRVTANGLNATSNNAGGGSGGSIWLTPGILSGAGQIAADGGSGHLPLGGGGSGGRITITYTSNLFSGTYSAKGGAGFGNGAAGTIYLKANNSNPTFIADNGGLAGTNTVFDQFNLVDLKVLGGAYLSNSTFSSIAMNSLTIASNSTWVGGSTITVASNATVAGLLTVDSVGNGNNPGVGSSIGSGGGGGAGAGGAGFGAPGGAPIVSIVFPGLPGGRGGNVTGPGSLGGGALHLTVNGLLSLQGAITANGGIGSSNTLGGIGGAGGGSVWLTVSGLSGSGSVRADGGAGFPGLTGGGGGGHIAVYYTSNTFTGTYSAKGGTGYMNGGAGTIYTKANTNFQGKLIVDNGGVAAGTNTVWDSSSGSLSDVTFSGGCIVTSGVPSISINNLTIGSNASLLLGPSVTLTLSGSGLVSSGGAIISEGSGTGSGFGPSLTCGAGHAGYGGRGSFAAVGGIAYDSAATPTIAGSRGGGGLQFTTAGGAGGGAMKLTVNGLLTLNGKLSANGSTVSSNSTGGGSGGSIWLNVGGLTGTGSISANGGSGNLPGGGGGGGGRIALYYTSNTFTGALSAKGGSGFAAGGAGTIYTRANNSNTATILVDNGGVKATNTAVFPANFFDVIVQNGGIATQVGNPRDLILHSNGWVNQTGSVLVSRNATIEAGGGINLDGLGATSSGAGFTSSSQAGGGGHGGYGGRQFGASGLAYDSVFSPTLGGSPGGNGSGSSSAPLGGAGGGAAHINVGNTLTVAGQVSASGLDGDVNSGGGSGGSIWIEATTLTGAGSISANGGRGNGNGGGGAGGRIAIYYSSNLYSGSITCAGGSGYEAGGAGTVYSRSNLSLLHSTQLALDNSGASGAITPLSQSFGIPEKVTVANGAIGQFQGAIPVLSNVVVSAGGTLTGAAADTNLDLAVSGDMDINSGGALQLNGKGFGQGSGPGAGSSLSSKGSGAGYGGGGGASASSAPGGSSYGSASQPVDRGSGGGSGSGPAGGSQGGGALRLSVSQHLTVDGVLSANGNDGVQDDSGGGSGGSIWVTAESIAGAGTITANGGKGEPSGGGGGAGGRIALYSPNNSFAGQMSVTGGDGASSGGTGTVFTAAVVPGFSVVSQNPTNYVSNIVSSVALDFSSAIDPPSLSSTTASLITPNGSLASTDISLSLFGPSTLIIAFPLQNTPGAYQVQVDTGIRDLFVQSLSQTYTGAFTISIPVISGTVRDTNNAPVAGVTLQENSSPFLAATTDANGIYSLGVDPGWSGTIVPSLSSYIFVPASRSYTNVSASASNQDFVVVTSLSPVMSGFLQGTNFGLSWYGISGATYQAQSSTNLVDWVPFGSATIGTNGPSILLIPIDLTDPNRFFRIQASE